MGAEALVKLFRGCCLKDGHVRAGRWVRLPGCEPLDGSTASHSRTSLSRHTMANPRQGLEPDPASILVTHPLGEGAKGLTGSEA